MMRLETFKKGTLAALLLLSGLAITAALAGCERESPSTKSTEAIKTGMTETAETVEKAKLASTEAAATAKDLAQSATEGTGDLAQKGMEHAENLAERGTEKATELMKTGDQVLDQTKTQVEGKMQVAFSPEEGAIEAGKNLMSTSGAERMLDAASALPKDQSGTCFAQVEIPPTYEMVTEQVLLPETGDYRTVAKKNLVSEGRMEQRAIVCEADIKSDMVIDIQKALNREGFNPGPIDGIVGPATMKALNGYQKANNLPMDKHLNLATIKALGIQR